MGMEIVSMTKPMLQWTKTRVTGPTRKQMKAAVQQLSESADERFRLITHLFGKQFVCEIGNVTIFTAGTSSRPSRIVPIAISAESPDWVAFPLTSSEDFVDLCQRLGFGDDMARNEQNKFLTPRSKRHD